MTTIIKNSITCLAFFISCNNAIAQHTGKMWWGSTIGITDIISDLETRDHLFMLPGKNTNGLNISLAAAYEFEIGSRYSVEYLFRMQKNNDVGSANYRGRSIQTFMNEIAVTAQYDLFRYMLSLDLPVMIYTGGTVSYFFAKHHFKVDEYFGPSSTDIYQSKSKGMVFYLNLDLLYQINDKIRVGINSRYGFAGNDFLEGYSTSDSKYNDHIVSYSLVFYYRFEVSSESKNSSVRNINSTE